MPLKQRKTDYHCHILPGIDDGPVERKTSIEMARLLSQAGYSEVYCTPHLIKGIYEATTQEVLDERERLQRELEKNGIAIKLLAGREYYLDEFLLEFIRQPLLLEGTNCFMIEIPPQSAVDLVKETLFEVTRRGYLPIIAHPERCPLLETPESETNKKSGWKSLLSRNPSERNENESGNDLLQYLKRLGCHFQANLGSFSGHYGSSVKNNARNLEKNGTYDYAGTDAHSPETIKEIFGLR